jgi:hypothetical protein
MEPGDIATRHLREEALQLAYKHSAPKSHGAIGSDMSSRNKSCATRVPFEIDWPIGVCRE